VSRRPAHIPERLPQRFCFFMLGVKFHRVSAGGPDHSLRRAGLPLPAREGPRASPLRGPANRLGFTLLEMIVATAIMSIAVVGLLSLLSATMSNASRVRQYDRAAMLARTKMNELLLAPPTFGQPSSGRWDDSTGWTATAAIFERPPNAGPGAFQLVRIDLEVWWLADGRRKSVTLEGFRRDEIRAPGTR